MSALASQITSLMIVYSNVYSRRRTKKTSKLRVTGLCAGNSPMTGERASNAEIFQFDDVTMNPLRMDGMIITARSNKAQPNGVHILLDVSLLWDLFTWTKYINQLIPGRYILYLRWLNFNHIPVIAFYSISWETHLIRMQQGLVDDELTLVQVMDCCRQATRHYLKLIRSNFVTAYGFTRSQWVDLSNCWFSMHGPLTRYVKLRVAHMPGMPGTFYPSPTS